MQTLAEVILPLPVKSLFHYQVPLALMDEVAIGKRVLVSFGKRKLYTGVIRRLGISPGEKPIHKFKPIEEILDDEPTFSEAQLVVFEWMAFYYFCTPGEVFKAALPQGLKPESALHVEATPGLEWDHLPLDDKEFLLMEALAIQPVLGFKEIAAIWQVLNPSPRLKTMETRGLIRLYARVEETYKPKYKRYLRLSPNCTSEAQLEQAFESLSRAPSQENLLMRIVSAYYQGKLLPKSETLKELEIGSQVAKVLVEKGYIEEEQVQVDRLELYGYRQHNADITLNPEQAEALSQIRAHFEAQPRKPVLLHGVTGSGKTHLYIELIQEALSAGKQVLYLLPEITLTKQIIDRVKSAFGEQVGIYHSRFNDAERVEIWKKVRKRSYQVVVGVRSAIFLPFQELGLIVVDEEHDSSFKQFEPAPRYHARDAAIYYALSLDIPIILGSATPAFESYANARQGKYALVELKKRAIATQMPTLELVDMRIQRKKKLLTGIFSNALLEAITEALARKEQIILFQNRRGYAPYLLCETCGFVPECVNCDISLTFHKERSHLRCHYCGHTDLNTQKCDNCGNFTLRKGGIGTEKISEAVQKLFPEQVVERMDWDTTRSKMGYQQIINRFENHQIDILVGTQMVSKGLDFENVTLVGVIHADHLLSFPDFRAYEKAYQLLTQVSGRAGRSEKAGRVLVQSYMPENIVLNAIDKPFVHFFEREILTRREVGYPPYTRLIRIEVRHKDPGFIEQESRRLQQLLLPYFGSNLLGPDFALVPRVRNRYRMHFLVKIGKSHPAAKVRAILTKTIEQYFQDAPKKTLRILVDIDPLGMG